MKPTLDTHKTDCNYPWWEIPLKNSDKMYIAVYVAAVDKEILLRVDPSTGFAYDTVTGGRKEVFDLVPKSNITHCSLGLPKNCTVEQVYSRLAEVFAQAAKECQKDD